MERMPYRKMNGLVRKNSSRVLFFLLQDVFSKKIIKPISNHRNYKYHSPNEHISQINYDCALKEKA